MTANEKYWIERAERRMDNYTMAAFDAANIVKRSYNSMCSYVEGEIAKILKHIGDEDSPAYEYRMKRLSALLANTQKKMQEQYGVNLLETTAFLREIIPEAYYHTIYDIAHATGVQPQFSAVNDRLISKIINENWSGQNYSKRIWSNTDKLADTLREVLTEAAMSGESIYKTSRKVSEAFDTAAYNAQRLIRTETTYATNQAELLAEKELDIDRYKFVATLDTRTSSICQKQDGKIYKTDDAKPGVNFPPMHPNCRSTHIGYFPDGMPQIRAARDKDGNRITVPADMTYDEWYEKYIGEKQGKKRPNMTQGTPKGKDTTPKPATAKTGENEAATIDIPAPAVEETAYTEEKIPKKPELTVYEEREQNQDKIKATLHDVEEKRRGLKHEVGTIIDREGNIIAEFQGEEHSVSVDDGMLKDLIFTHNHPSGGCFSDGDIENMIADGLLELRASTPQGTYYSLVRTANADKNSTFAYDYKKANSIVTATKQVQEDLKKGIITKQDMKDKGFNLYIEYMSKNAENFLAENAAKYGYIYTKGVI